MTGLGLDDFLTHNQGGGGRRKFFGKWKDDGVAIVWISTRANIAYPSWNHPFYKLDVVENKKTGEEEEILRFVRFVSPDPEIVHQQQHFRNKEDDTLQTPPVSDPFLLLREWLREEIKAERLDLDTVVFEWEDPKKRETIEWTAGEISRMQERGQSNWNHSLDSKLEYLFVIVDNENPDEGPQITRETKLIGDQMKEEISAQIESEGAEDGNPLVNPYAFKWKFNKNESSPMKMYTAKRYNRAKLTDEIRDAITDPDFPDPTPDTKPRPGDKAKIRAAFEEAAQIDLPWDLLFDNTPWDDDDPTSFDFGENAKGKGKGKGKTSGKPKSDKPKGKAKGSSSKSDDEDKPKTRRRRKKKPEPEPEPEEDLIKCDDCPQMLKPTATVCPGCGAEYDVDGDDEDEEEEPEPKPKSDKPKGKAKGKGSSSGKSKGKGKGKSKPEPEPEPEDDEDDEDEEEEGSDDGDDEDEECWSCGGEIGDDNKCKNCGLDAGDELPL